MIEKTPEELRGQRARLIASTGLTETVLRERAEAHQLYPEHHDIWATVESIDYLLSDTTEVPAPDEPHQRPRIGQQSDLAADAECAIGLNTGGGGAGGVYAARDAVLAVRDQELERLRACLTRVRAIADQLASCGRLGVDLEADGIRRGIAQQLHDALGATPNVSEEAP